MTIEELRKKLKLGASTRYLEWQGLRPEKTEAEVLDEMIVWWQCISEVETFREMDFDDLAATIRDGMPPKTAADVVKYINSDPETLESVPEEIVGFYKEGRDES